MTTGRINQIAFVTVPTQSGRTKPAQQLGWQSFVRSFVLSFPRRTPVRRNLPRAVPTPPCAAGPGIVRSRNRLYTRPTFSSFRLRQRNGCHKHRKRQTNTSRPGNLQLVRDTHGEESRKPCHHGLTDRRRRPTFAFLPPHDKTRQRCHKRYLYIQRVWQC